MEPRNVTTVWDRIERTAARIEETCPKPGTLAYQHLDDGEALWCFGAREVLQLITDGMPDERRGHGQGVSGENQQHE